MSAARPAARLDAVGGPRVRDRADLGPGARVETGWWRGADVRRDYYVAETTDGERFWLFRDLAAGGWFVHGVFE